MYINAWMKSYIWVCAEDCKSLLPVCICHAELWANAPDIVQTTRLDVQAFGKQTTPEVCWGLNACVKVPPCMWTATLSARENKKKQKSGCAPVQQPPACFSLSLDWVPAFHSSCSPVLMKECTHVHDPHPRLTNSHSNTSKLYWYGWNASYYLLDTTSVSHTLQLCPYINTPVQLICYGCRSTLSILLCSIQILSQPLAAPWVKQDVAVEIISSPIFVLPACNLVA